MADAAAPADLAADPADGPAADPAGDPADDRPGGLVAAAERAIRASGVDPRVAREEARRVLDAAEGRGDAEAASVALRALALAARELGDLPLAESHLLEAIRVGAAVPRRLAQARMSLVSVRTERGDLAGALRLADQAENGLPAADRPALAVQRAIVLVRLGRHEQAVRMCDQALAGPGVAGDPRLYSAALLNRGLALTYLGDHDAGAEDLTACLRVAAEAGLDYVTALAEANLSFNAVRRGDIPAAFASYSSAERRLAGYPERLAALRGDFAEALVAAHLPGEARALLRRAVPELAAAGALVHLAEARLFLAQVELMAGDPHGALATARLAREELAGQGRDTWVPLADDVIVRARLALEPAGRPLLDEMLACADALHRTDRPATAAALRLTAARLAADLGDPGAAAHQLDQVIAGQPPARQGRAPTRTDTLIFHHAVALRRRLAGDHAGALAAVHDGLAALGAPDASWDIRAHAARPAQELAELGLDLALRTGRGDTALAWAERWRACVRAEPPAVLAADRLRDRLGDATLIELVRHGDALAAVIADRTGCALHRLGSYRAAVEATVRLRYCLRRRGLRDAGAGAGVAREAAALSALLLAPLVRDPRPGPVVIVPTGALHTVPWPVLPPLRGRPVCVAPSAAAWLAALGVPAPDGGTAAAWPGTRARVAAVAGPGLAHAETEAATVSQAHPGAVRVPARADAVLEALRTADIVHIAAHGMFFAHSPLLSSITLDDGPLMAYDLLRLDRAPRLVILSACDAGLAHAPADGAPLGLAGTLLERGAACVVAGLVPVRDDESLTLMTAFHELLAGGVAPAMALAAATETTGVPGFACLGAGWTADGLRNGPADGFRNGPGDGMAAGRAGYSAPVATGRAGSVIQWDQKPT